jgi:hypothetical protein
LPWKVYAGYLAFGFGGAALLFVLAFHALWILRRTIRCRIWLFFLALGLALPIMLYIPQMFSTRHTTLAALATITFICAPVGRMVFRAYLRSRFWNPAVKSVLVLSSVLPVFLGLDLTVLHHPSPTFSQPTLFPTAAGFSPMGAYLAHGFHVHALHGLVDQNQAIWQAAMATSFEADADGNVPLLRTPCVSYSVLAIHMQNKRPGLFDLSPARLSSRFYVESRSLLHYQFAWPPPNMTSETFFPSVALHPVSASDWRGVTILRNEADASLGQSWSAPLWAFNRVFDGDEFRLESLESLQSLPAAWSGRKLVLASCEDFTAATAEPVKTAEFSSRSLGHWRTREIGPLHGGDRIIVQSNASAKIYVAVGVFPEWMSLKNY